MSVGPIQNEGAVRFETNLGRITFLLFPDSVTPLTNANFLNNYVDAGLYDNTIVHRSVAGFVIQAGGYKDTSGYPHVTQADPVPNEFANDQAYVGAGNPVNTRGTVSMAKLGSDPNSATSEFFINLADNSSNLDAQNGGFTTFARVIGGGMHVADAIANLPQENASSLNSAFDTLPVINTSSGSNPVIISSAKAQRVLPVTLDSTTKYATWIDEKGGKVTISLSSGTADLTFVGGTDMTYSTSGNHVYIKGNNVDLEEIDTHNTSKSSTLSINSVGGKGPAHIGDIIADGSLGAVSARSVLLQGDLTAAGSVGSIDLQGTYRSTLSTTGGTTDIKIRTALDTSISVSGGTIKSLTAGVWHDDGELATSITANNLDSLKVNGNFSSNLTIIKDIGSIKINGNVGTLGPTTWTVGGSISSVKVGKVMGLTARVVKDIASFNAREVLSSFANSTATATNITAGSIGKFNAATLTNQSVIDSSSNIKSLTIRGAMDSSTIRAVANLGQINLHSVTGNFVDSSTGSVIASGIYAGVVDTFSGSPVTLPGSFLTDSAATINHLNIRGTFSNTNIAAPILANVAVGNVQAASTTHFGVTAHNRIGHLTANVKGKSVYLVNARSQDDIDAYLTKIKLPLDNASNGNRFTIALV